MAGVSDNENKQVAKQWIDELNPRTVLDVGAGTGTYSMLARKPGQYWAALEVFYPYVRMFDLRNKYDDIFIADARIVDFAKIGAIWDLSIAADMLEHMSKDDAIDIIYELVQCSEHVLLCFPVEHNPQHAGEEGNDFETHVDHWHYEEMKNWLDEAGMEVEKDIVGDVLAYFLIKGYHG